MQFKWRRPSISVSSNSSFFSRSSGSGMRLMASPFAPSSAIGSHGCARRALHRAGTPRSQAPRHLAHGDLMRRSEAAGQSATSP